MSSESRPSQQLAADRDWDAIIIGSGLGGLSCAAYLATNGKRVLVLEQGHTIGGNSQVFRRFGKYEFDVGVHYIGDCEPGGAIPNVLRGVGLEGRVQFERLDPDGYITMVAPDFDFRIPLGWERYEQRLIEQFPHERRRIHRCLRTLRSIGERLGSAEVPTTRGEIARFVAKRPLNALWGLQPLSRLLKFHGLSQWAQAVIAAEAGDYAAAPSRAPVAMHAALMHHFLKDGGYYPKGGGHVIAANLLDVIEAHGGLARTQATVSEIEIEDGGARGVTLADGRRFAAPVVVSNADIKRTYLELIGERNLKASTVKRVKGYRMAPAIFCVFLALDVDLRERFGATQFLLLGRDGSFAQQRPIDALERVYSEASAGRLDPESEPSVYVTSASTKDRTSSNHAPDGHSTLELMTLVPSDPAYWRLAEPHGSWADEHYSKDEGYRRIKQQLAERMIERTTELIPDLRAHIVWQEEATPITQERYTRSTAGTSYGIDLAVDQFGIHRPTASTEIAGLYLAGASTRWGHGILGSLSGGVGAASAVLGRNLRAEVEAGRIFGDPTLLPVRGPDWDPLMACRRHADKTLRAAKVHERARSKTASTPTPA